MPYVITCGDEGVQINEGTRLAFAGSGFKLEGFSTAVSILKELLKEDIRIVTHSECGWIREQLELSNWEQTEASSQQYIESLADREGLMYSGILPFADPRELNHGVKGHMVRPKGIHIANKIMFTLAGGEQTYNLGCYVISADWVAEADKKVVKEMMEAQMEHYKALAKGNELAIIFEAEGPLGAEVAEANRQMLESVGITESK
ncbi:hypothetical protein KC721_02545 [Candidatus Woesebacteria bacterium]|nr:hypothetical protein [Candidatus Woesebacteria bacterium]